MSNKPKVAVVGATGQFGHPLTLNLVSEGADVLAISRGANDKNQAQLDALKAAGCELGFNQDPNDEKQLVELFEGCDTVVLVTAASPENIRTVHPLYVSAAKKAGVTRFVPTEFGCHTLGLKKGAYDFFDSKKFMQEKIEEAGLQKTLIYPALNADYCLPNLRFFHQITTFGDLDLPITTHQIDDIGVISAKAIIDPRTAGKAVQMYHNRLSQREMLDLLHKYWPDHDFPIAHVSTESIVRDMESGADEITGKAGVETDRERAQINYVCYVSGELANIDYPDTLNASELYPDFVYQTPEELISSKTFVFGN